MEKAKKNLKIWSVLYIALAIFDAVSIVGVCLSGNLNSSDVPENMRTAVITVLLGLMALIALSKLFLGIQGYRQANGKTKGTGHITFAKVVFVLSIITFVASISNVINEFNFEKISNLSLDLVGLVVVYDYIKQAKYIKENN